MEREDRPRRQNEREEIVSRKEKLGMEEIQAQVVPAFQTEGVLEEMCTHGNGHINETYKVSFRLGTGERRQYVLQRINTDVFKNPWELTENIENVTAFLRKKSERNGGDPLRETLSLIPVQSGGTLLEDAYGNYWRMYLFIEGTVCLENVEKTEDLYNSAFAFGNFQRLLSDFPATSLHEVIPNFHHTPGRYEDFNRAVQEDVCGRVESVAEEIRFIREREADLSAITACLVDGSLPLRVTHNDTKLNNILFDAVTGKGICVIDLDTVMPGSALYDFGDAIRFGASTGAEDEKDLDRISCSLELFETYTRGYLKGCGGTLTEQEIRMLPMGAKLMTLECGMRFLTDYLQGDTYFRIHREEHNLDRARTQFKLVRDMEEKWEEMTKIVERVREMD